MDIDTLIGQQLGAYSIQTKLGEGGMARVYKAYHARLRREVAIKVILAQIADQADFKVRFEREAQLVASLHHPNIVAVYDFGDYGKLTYLVMQYVGGGTLRDRLRGGHALDPRQATLYTIQMGKALHHAHLRGIVHRDVKPQNILVSEADTNQLLLSDFGIAKLNDARREPTLIGSSGTAIGNDPSLTNVGQIVGTAEYMAPEQIEGRPVDGRTDVYALGVVLFQMLTGEAPFQSTTVQGLLYQHVYTPPRPVREVNPYISEILAWIVSKAMAKAPADRFQSAEEMAQALEAVINNATYQLGSSMPLSTIADAPERSSLTMPSQQRPSFYSQPPQAAIQGIEAASQYGQYGQQNPQVSSNTPASGMTRSRTSASGVSASPLPLHPRRSVRPLNYVGAGLVMLLAVALILAKTGVLSNLGGGSTNNPITSAQSFTDTFHDNHLSWLSGSSNGLNASFAQNSYILDIPGVATATTYFPYPTSEGYLPATFTWAAQIEQTKGQSAPYGLAFNLKESGGNVSCYAFVINGQGGYEVLKYLAGNPTPVALTQGSSPAIHTGLNQINQLQGRVQNGTFTFTINGSAIQTQSPITDNSGSTPYTQGEPALLVAGSPNSEVSFTVTQVQLTVG